jgi:predicted MPP superfamily phosphohydrolase
MFFATVLSIWLLMHLYVFWRASSVPFIQRNVHRLLLTGIAALLGSSYLLSRMLSSLPWLARPLEIVGANWIGLLFLAFVCLLVADLITLFGYAFTETAPTIRGIALSVSVVLAAVALIQGMRPPQIESYEVRVNNLPTQMDGTVIVMMSDLHLGSLLGEDWAAARVQQVMNLHPDLIVLCGDILEGDDPSESGLLIKLQQLSAPLGVWAVAGNHESHGHNGVSNNALQSAGVRVLRNEWAEIRPGMVISGVQDLTHVQRSGLNPNDLVIQALIGRPSDAATVFVSHSPIRAELAASRGVSLMLSGHTHNGQIWPFNYFVQQLNPYMSGIYDVESMKLIVCRGTGTWGPRMRLWRRGEIVKITIHPTQ